MAAILSIELLAACQALDLLAPLKSGVLAEKARALVRRAATQVTSDRSLHADITRLGKMVFSGEFARILG